MGVSIADTGAGSVGTFRLENDGKERVAIRVAVLTRSMGEDGKETNGAAGTQFLVFPSRFVLEPGAQRSFKVQWKGGPVGDSEFAFRVVAEQLPVEFQERQGSGITILFKYVGSLYVVPAKARPAETVVKSAVGIEKNSKRGVMLQVENRGGTHVIMVESKLGIKIGDQDYTMLDPEALEEIEGQNMLAGVVRNFFVPFPEATIGESYDVRFSYDAER
jgi:fimbrial chaperone protein